MLSSKNVRLAIVAALVSLIGLQVTLVVAGDSEDVYEGFRAELEAAKEAFWLDSNDFEEVLTAGLRMDRLLDIPKRFTLDDALVFDRIDHSVGKILAGHAYESLGPDYTDTAIECYKRSIQLCNPSGTNRGIVTKDLLSLLTKDLEKHYSDAVMVVSAFAEESTDASTAHDLFQALIRNLIGQNMYTAAAECSARCIELMNDEFSPMCEFLGGISALSTGDRARAYQLYEEGTDRHIRMWSDMEKLRDCSFYSLSSTADFEELLDENPELERIITREKVELSYTVEQAECSTQDWPFFLARQSDGSYKVAQSRREQDRLYCPGDLKEAVVYRITDATVVGGFIIHQQTCSVFSVGAPILLPRFPAPTLEDQLGRGAFPIMTLEQVIVSSQVGGSDYNFLVTLLPQLMTTLSDMSLPIDPETGVSKTLNQLRAISPLPPAVSMAASIGNFHSGWLVPDTNNHVYKADEAVIVDWAFVDPSNPYGDGVVVDGDEAKQIRRPPFPSDFGLPPQEFLSYTKKTIPTRRACMTNHASTIVYVRPHLFSGEDGRFIEELDELAEDRGLQLFVFEENWDLTRIGKESPLVDRLELGQEENGDGSSHQELSFQEKAKVFADAAIIISATSGGAEAGILFVSPSAAVVQFHQRFPDAALSGRITKGAGAEYWTVPSLVVDTVNNEVSIDDGAFGATLATVEYILNSKRRRSLCGEEDSN